MDSLLLTHQVVVQLLSRAQLFAIPGFPVLHYLPEFAQTNVHEVSDAIQPSHPVTTTSSCPQSFPASGSFPLRQLFTSGAQSIGAHGHGDFLSLPLSVCSSHTSLLTAFSPPEEGTAAAAAAKSLQSCPTLCDPIGGSPPAVFP